MATDRLIDYDTPSRIVGIVRRPSRLEEGRMFDFEDWSEEEVEAFRQKARELTGSKLFEVFEEAVGRPLPAALAAMGQVLGDHGAKSDREEAADKILENLIPSKVDISLWSNLVAGRNVDLPASDQYGPIAARLAPESSRAAHKGRGNAYGRVHSKGTQEPSGFMRRQGEALKARYKRIAEIELQLEEEKSHTAELEHGLKLYAMTLLMTELRSATAPIFAMGPAWAILRAIAGKTGDEKTDTDRARDSHRIMVVLHALRENEDFLKAIKCALLQVCQNFSNLANERGKNDPFDGPWDYEEVLSSLDWPPPPGRKHW
jgi:hypothetical protein